MFATTNERELWEMVQRLEAEKAQLKEQLQGALSELATLRPLKPIAEAAIIRCTADNLERSGQAVALDGALFDAVFDYMVAQEGGEK